MFFFFKQKTAYDMRISDWSSDVCSSDLSSYFALAIIRQLEKLGVYTCNNSTAIETVKDKMFLAQLLGQSDLPIPKTMLVKFPVSLAVVEREIGLDRKSVV